MRHRLIHVFTGITPIRQRSALASLVIATVAAAAIAAQDDAGTIERQRAALLADPASASARDTLKRLIDRPDPVPRDQYEKIQGILRQFPWPGEAVLAWRDEPGQPLIVSGTVRGAHGAPLDGALLHVFHTDAEGHYTRSAVMDEPHARLFAYIKTRADGRFQFRTIRPGGYPGSPDRQGEQWRIPQHIHFEISAHGYQERRFQMVFDDDPRMTAYWHEWAARGGHPIVMVTRGADGVQRATCNISLQ